MKKFALVICVFLGFVFFSSCETESKKENIIENQVVKEGGNSDPCCEVQCRRGSCKTYKSPCSCTCIAGQPACGGINNGGGTAQKGNPDGIVVVATMSQLALYDKDIEYLKTLPQSEKAVEALENIKKLLVKNKLRISAGEDIFSYNKNLEIYAGFINTQTEEVVDRLSSLE